MADQPVETWTEVKKGNPILPDTLFKTLTRREVEENNLRVSESEFQHITRADLIIEVPQGVDTSKTLFDFCYPVSVLEFKSENDEFNIREFVVNQIRTAILFLQSREKEEDYSRYLNTYVLARLPKDFLDNAAQNGIVFTTEEGKPWLWRAKIGFQNVALIVCRDLPLESQYYPWLLFAPSDGKKWQAFIRRLVVEKQDELLDFAQKLRPREVSMIRVNSDELWELARREGALTPEVEARLAKERAEAVQIILNDLDNKAPIQIKLFINDMTDAQLVQLLDSLSIRRLAAVAEFMTPEQLARASKLAKTDKQRQLLQFFIDEPTEPS